MARQFDRETRVARNTRAVWRGFENEVAIIAPSVAAVRTLNEVGARCWQLADGRTLGAIADALEAEFEVDRETLERDLIAFLVALDERGLLEPEAR